MKTAHDNPNIARMIYEAPTSAPSSPSGVTIDHIAVMIRDLGTEIREQRSEQSSEFREMIREWREMEDRMMNTLDTRFNALSNNIAGTSEKKKEYTEYETEKDFLDAKSDDGKYDKAEIRNRTVTETETLSLVPDFGKDAKENGNEGEVTGQDPKPEENKMNDDDRTVNEIFSPVADLGQDTKNETEKNAGDPKRESNVSEPITDVMEIRDQGGGGGGGGDRKGR